MDIKFRVEIEIDDEKVIAEDKYYLEDVYAAIDKVFKDNNVPKLKSDSEKLLIYGTKKHDKFSNILVSVNTVILSELNPYIKKAIWYNYELNEQEDILETFRKEGLTE
jgi:hypothetical protein